jgi:hypothetical protein
VSIRGEQLRYIERGRDYKYEKRYYCHHAKEAKYFSSFDIFPFISLYLHSSSIHILAVIDGPEGVENKPF